MTVDLSTLSPSVRRRIERRTLDLLAFASPIRAKAVPAALRHNLTREAFLALSVEQREAHIRSRVPAMVLAERAERAERRATEQAVAESAAAEPIVAISIAPAFRPGELFAISDDFRRVGSARRHPARGGLRSRCEGRRSPSPSRVAR